MIVLHEKQASLVRVFLVENEPRFRQEQFGEGAFLVVDLLVKFRLGEPDGLDVAQLLAENGAQLPVSVVDVAVDPRNASVSNDVQQRTDLFDDIIYR